MRKTCPVVGCVESKWLMSKHHCFVSFFSQTLWGWRIVSCFLLFSRVHLARLGLQDTEAMKAHLDQRWVLEDTKRDPLKASYSQKHTQNVFTTSKCFQQTCRMSCVSGLIIPFISQGPRGPRGIKGAPGDRGQIGERVSVGDTCVPFIIFSGCVFLICKGFCFFIPGRRRSPRKRHCRLSWFPGRTYY